MQIITLSASANKLSKIQERADEYAALIMEELDPDNLGYVEVCIQTPPLMSWPVFGPNGLHQPTKGLMGFWFLKGIIKEKKQ